MKFFSLPLVLLVATFVFAASCERHEFEGPDGTKQLHQKHSAHVPGHKAEDGAEPHGEKPAH